MKIFSYLTIFVICSACYTFKSNTGIDVTQKDLDSLKVSETSFHEILSRFPEPTMQTDVTNDNNTYRKECGQRGDLMTLVMYNSTKTSTKSSFMPFFRTGEKHTKTRSVNIFINKKTQKYCGSSVTQHNYSL